MVTLRLIYILMRQILLIAVELKAYICANYTGNPKFVYWPEQCKLICLNVGREFISRPKAFNFFVIFSNIWCRFKKFQPFFKIKRNNSNPFTGTIFQTVSHICQGKEQKLSSLAQIVQTFVSHIFLQHMVDRSWEWMTVSLWIFCGRKYGYEIIGDFKKSGKGHLCALSLIKRFQIGHNFYPLIPTPNKYSWSKTIRKNNFEDNHWPFHKQSQNLTKFPKRVSLEWSPGGIS